MMIKGVLTLIEGEFKTDEIESLINETLSMLTLKAYSENLERKT